MHVTQRVWTGTRTEYRRVLAESHPEIAPRSFRSHDEAVIAAALSRYRAPYDPRGQNGMIHFPFEPFKFRIIRDNNTREYWFLCTELRPAYTNTILSNSMNFNTLSRIHGQNRSVSGGIYSVDEFGVIHSDGEAIKQVEPERRLVVILVPRFTTRELIERGYDREPFVRLMKIMHDIMMEHDDATIEIIEELFSIRISDYNPDRMLPLLQREWFRSATDVVRIIGNVATTALLFVPVVGKKVAALIKIGSAILSGTSVVMNSLTMISDGNLAGSITSALVEGGLIVFSVTPAGRLTVSGRGISRIERTARSASTARKAANTIYLVSLYHLESGIHKAILKGAVELFKDLMIELGGEDIEFTYEDLAFFFDLRYTEIGGN